MGNGFSPATKNLAGVRQERLPSSDVNGFSELRAVPAQTPTGTWTDRERAVKIVAARGKKCVWRLRGKGSDCRPFAPHGLAARFSSLDPFQGDIPIFVLSKLPLEADLSPIGFPGTSGLGLGVFEVILQELLEVLSLPASGETRNRQSVLCIARRLDVAWGTFSQTAAYSSVGTRVALSL